MVIKLFHYVHCPFCLRIRMTLGYLGQQYESVVLPYDDENTPVDLTGKKMLPIVSLGSKVINESLDIMIELDQDNRLKIRDTLAQENFKAFEELLSRIGSPVHSLAMPFWIWSPEFSDSSRNYFRAKKEIKRGPFKELVKNQATYADELFSVLASVETDLKPFYQSQDFTVRDILLAAHLWGVYSVPEFRLSDKLHSYLQSVKSICRFQYYEPLWEKL